MPSRGCGLDTLLILALIFLTGGMIIPIAIIGLFIFWLISMIGIVKDDYKNKK